MPDALVEGVVFWLVATFDVGDHLSCNLCMLAADDCLLNDGCSFKLDDIFGVSLVVV